MSTNSHTSCCDKCDAVQIPPIPSGVKCWNDNCPCHTDRVEVPYNQIDHYHCWEHDEEDIESFSPPCGQKIEHLKCCLCEIINPIVSALITQAREEAVREHDAKWHRIVGTEMKSHEYTEGILEGIRICKERVENLKGKGTGNLLHRGSVLTSLSSLEEKITGTNKK